MAKLEDLLQSIADPKLRDEITREVERLKEDKKFGLVFEEHIPELAQLLRLPIKPGARVTKRGGQGNETFTVQAVNGKQAKLWREPDGPEETAPKGELIVVKKFGEPIYPALTPVDRMTRAPGQPYHTLINADNFHALQLLTYCYTGKVDVIYIDPPYNTGARDWKYNNDYVDTNDTYRHSKWLAMMRKRLKIAKRLLKPEGLMVIAIDDCEMHRLRLLLEEADLYGEGDFIGTVVVRSKPSGNQTQNELAVSHEYAFFIAASDKARIHAMERNEKQLARFDQQDDTGAFYWENLRRHGANSRREDRPGLYYPIWLRDSDGKIEIPKLEWNAKYKRWISNSPPKGMIAVLPLRGDDERIWAYSPDRAKKELSNLIARKTNDDWQVYRKVRMREVGIMPQTLWTDKQYSATEYQ